VCFVPRCVTKAQNDQPPVQFRPTIRALLQDRWTSAIAQGDYEGAWDISAALLGRLDPATRDDPRLPYHRRWVWDGTALRGRDVLVRCYHGLGDTIQFLRYLPLLRKIAASVTLEVQPALIP
jgi:hypothetical protein